MTTDHTTKIFSDYALKFGEDAAEAFMAPNWLGDAGLIAALESAVKSGQPLALDEAAARFGPPFWESVIP